MKCPHCTTAMHLKYKEDEIVFLKSDDQDEKRAIAVGGGNCPNCGQPVVLVNHGTICFSPHGSGVTDIEKAEILFPKHANVKSPPNEAPESLAADFVEAAAVLPISPQASAALSRRILQRILRDHFKVKKSSLAKEIDEFLEMPGIPTYLTTAVDAIRNVGNLAAHPLKEKETGIIVKVEPGEAEWLIDVLESLFDFAYVQPKVLERRRDELNKKLRDAGKPEMKGPSS